jgi:hypothetical protein
MTSLSDRGPEGSLCCCEQQDYRGIRKREGLLQTPRAGVSRAKRRMGEAFIGESGVPRPRWGSRSAHEIVSAGFHFRLILFAHERLFFGARRATTTLCGLSRQSGAGRRAPGSGRATRIVLHRSIASRRTQKRRAQGGEPSLVSKNSGPHLRLALSEGKV